MSFFYGVRIAPSSLFVPLLRTDENVLDANEEYFSDFGIKECIEDLTGEEGDRDYTTADDFAELPCKLADVEVLRAPLFALNIAPGLTIEYDRRYDPFGAEDERAYLRIGRKFSAFDGELQPQAANLPTDLPQVQKQLSALFPALTPEFLAY
jgi:hypothetical protein